MPHVICDPCIGEKDKACSMACPVDCIYEFQDCSGQPEKGDDMLYINPDECIDCSACVDPCPVDAIFPDDEVPTPWQQFIDINAAAFE